MTIGISQLNFYHVVTYFKLYLYFMLLIHLFPGIDSCQNIMFSCLIGNYWMLHLKKESNNLEKYSNPVNRPTAGPQGALGVTSGGPPLANAEGPPFAKVKQV